MTHEDVIGLWIYRMVDVREIHTKVSKSLDHFSFFFNLWFWGWVTTLRDGSTLLKLPYLGSLKIHKSTILGPWGIRVLTCIDS